MEFDMMRDDEDSNFSLVAPISGADWIKYFDLRWRVLRAPWDQPRGSERDDREDTSIHLDDFYVSEPLLRSDARILTPRRRPRFDTWRSNLHLRVEASAVEYSSGLKSARRPKARRALS